MSLNRVPKSAAPMLPGAVAAFRVNLDSVPLIAGGLLCICGSAAVRICNAVENASATFTVAASCNPPDGHWSDAAGQDIAGALAPLAVIVAVTFMGGVFGAAAKEVASARMSASRSRRAPGAGQHQVADVLGNAFRSDDWHVGTLAPHENCRALAETTEMISKKR